MLTKITIKNFGSIKEEETIKFNKDITAFIGKNESGKSTVLKAINRLNTGKIELSDKNVLLKKEETIIEATFRLELEEIKKINSKLAKTTKYNFYKFPEEYGPLYYTKEINDSDITYYGLYYLDEDKKGNKTVETKISDIFIERIKNEIFNLLKDCIDISIGEFDNLLKEMSENEIKEYLRNLRIEDDKVKNELNELHNEIIDNNWINLLPKYKFIYFSSFKDILGDNILFEKINESSQALNILKVANINLEQLKKAFDENDEVTLGDMETEYIEMVSTKFKEIFQQTDENFKLKVRFGTNKKEILFLTQDKTSETKTINLSNRSDGFKWYLSLYLTLYDYLERENEEIKYILLLDEPNLYLHPGAQYNLLYNVFYKEFKQIQIIYTTHSPYMIDTSNSFSIRIVEKNDSTKIYNSTREYAEKREDLRDVDTMTPLLTALELNVSNDIIYDSKDKLFVVEGIQDVYLLKGMINKLKYNAKMKNIKFISGTTANKVPITYSYLFGMGYNVYTLVDNDKPGIDANKSIMEDYEAKELYENLLTYDVINDYSNDKFLLEDLMGKEDLKKYIPEKNTINYKRIYDDFDKMDFSDTTLSNFKKLFDLLIKK